MILHVRTNLGLVEGVEELGQALLDAGLAGRIDADVAPSVTARPYSASRLHPSGLLNADGLVDVARRQADAVGDLLDVGEFPVVLGGDDSILFGSLLALRRRGRYGLVFLDAHTDFYPPQDSPTGEASDSELYLAFGNGPSIIAAIDGRSPLVLAKDAVVIGQRDPDEPGETGEALAASGALAIDLAALRVAGAAGVAQRALDLFASADLDGFFIHIDADVLHDEVMPAVDYRLPDGLFRAEFVALVAPLLASPLAVGLDVAIYNPALDPDRAAAENLVACLEDAFSPSNAYRRHLPPRRGGGAPVTARPDS